MILLLGIFSGKTDLQEVVNENGNIIQVSLLVGLSFGHLVILYISRPLTSLRATYVENISSFGEFCTYIAALILVIFRRAIPMHVHYVLPIIDKLLLVAQLLAIMAKIGGQLCNVYTISSQIKRGIMKIVTPEKLYKQDRDKILAFKYACKWYIRVFNCPPPSRATYFISRKHKQLKVWEMPSNRANNLPLKYLL